MPQRQKGRRVPDLSTNTPRENIPPLDAEQLRGVEIIEGLIELEAQGYIKVCIVGHDEQGEPTYEITLLEKGKVAS